VRGEPGVGKTALLAQLVRTRGYVHHFNVAQNIVSHRAFVENVCAQLIIRYRLSDRSLPQGGDEDATFLDEVIAEASRAAKSEPIVIALDALDEAQDTGLAPAANRLHLPRFLPDGVYFLVTCREQMDYRLVVDARRDIHLGDKDPRNVEDIRQYVIAFIKGDRLKMAARIEAWGVDEHAFINVMADKSQGNFMYIVHVLVDIREGFLSKVNVDQISDLPAGLNEYYARHWRSMREVDPDQFDRFYEPVVRHLATVREPVSIKQLHDWTGLHPRQIRDVIKVWREFLNAERSSKGVELFRVYHVSFQEYLANEGVGLEPTHRNIARRIMSKFSGLFDGGAPSS
jgi:hypothetical protein